MPAMAPLLASDPVRSVGPLNSAKGEGRRLARSSGMGFYR